MTKCRICDSSLIEFLDLGKQPIANNFITEEQFKDEYFYKLQVGFCPTCLSVQVFDVPNKIDVFNDQYSFFTSTSKLVQEHLKKLADVIKPSLTKDSFVIDIGGNDGTFLKNLIDHCNILNIEPSGNVAKVALDNDVPSIIEFFTEGIADIIVAFGRRADFILTSHVFGHVADRSSFLSGIKKLLKDNGVWVVEDAYLKNSIEDVAYDQFYNEHIFYSTIASLQISLDMFGLEIFNIKLVDTHGGTIRYYISHKSKKQIQPIVYKLKEVEELNSIESFLLFGEQIKQSKWNLIVALEEIKKLGKEIVGYGASAKSTTILNYCQIGPSLISKLYDTTPIKHGKYSPGMHIPIVPYNTFKQDNPQNVVLFIWNHAKEIYVKEKNFNGRWIIPIGITHDIIC